MQLPTLYEETRLWNHGVRCVAGVDEVGRGPLAGPVVAAAVILQKKFCNDTENLTLSLLGYSKDAIKDSKKLSLAQRERIFNLLIENDKVDYGIGIVPEKVIDQINILKASLLAMKQAVGNLKQKVEFLLIDGQWTLEDVSINQKAIVNGDSKIFSIAAASIIAKVTRDRLMDRHSKEYPHYGFETHKGYGTRVHLEALKKYGPCEIHRKSFGPVKKAMAGKG